MGIDDTAAELLDMRRTGRIVADLPDALRPTDLANAYAVQDRLVAGLLGDADLLANTPDADAAHTTGYKCACTSPIAQKALRIDRPVYGRLMSHTTSPTGSTLPADRFTHRVIEAEFGFRVGTDVAPRAGGHTRDSIANHIHAAIPAIEIVDYRYEAWTVGALQVAADNAIHGWWIRGDPIEDWRDLDLAAVAVTVRRNGDVVTTGSGANVLGHPLDVMAWLADELPRYGRHLEAGDLVTTGVTTDVFEADAGDVIVAEFDGLGSVEVSFT